MKRKRKLWSWAYLRFWNNNRRLRDIVPKKTEACYEIISWKYIVIDSYKWANLKNCTKLHCEFHKWIKIIAFLCALKKITILFQLNGITDFVISSFKRTEPTSTHCTHEMCQWHKQPVPFDSLCRAYLIAVQCQFILTLAEKYFNRPSTHIPGKNLLCR